MRSAIITFCDKPVDYGMFFLEMESFGYCRWKTSLTYSASTVTPTRTKFHVKKLSISYPELQSR